MAAEVKVGDVLTTDKVTALEVISVNRAFAVGYVRIECEDHIPRYLLATEPVHITPKGV